MTGPDLRRIHAVTDNFFFWQGLRWIPLGIGLVVASLSTNDSIPLPAAVRAGIGLPILLVSLWLSTSVIGAYYSRHFGRVRTDPARHVTRSTVKWFFVYPAMVGSLIADIGFKLPVVISAIVFALAIEAYRESTGGGRHHYIVACIALVALAFLPLYGLLTPGVDAVGAMMGAIGIIYAIGGLLDHRELVRILGHQALSDAGPV
jgi:hypothetical protein